MPFEERLTSENVERILGEGWDVIVDGADNFPTRYLVNDASVWHGIPVVHGSIFRFEGQVTVFAPGAGPCYRCLFPQPPPPELAPSCAEGGVLGVLPGIIGSLQANEALKLILERGDTLAGRLLLFDALGTTLDEVTVRRDPDCPVCGDRPTITEYVDYVEFCNAPAVHGLMARGPHPPDAARRGRAGARELEAHGETVGDVIEDLVERYPPLRSQLFQNGELALVRQRLPRRRGHPDARRPRDARPRRRDRDPAAGDGRWVLGLTTGAPRADRLDAARRAPAPLAEARRFACTRSSRARTRPARSRIGSRRR